MDDIDKSSDTEGYHGRHIGLLEYYYESIGAVTFDVFNLHPFSCDSALAVHSPTEGGMRHRYIDDYYRHEVNDKLGINFNEWLANPDWRIRLLLKRLKLLNVPPPPIPPT
jgi:hypothetical protein